MKKIFRMKKQLVLWLLLTAFVLHTLIPEPFSAFAQETATTEDQISLESTNRVTASKEGAVLRICGERGTLHNVPITISANCTVILDHVQNEADLIVSDGVRAHIRLEGNNRLNDICATGGENTTVYIEGSSHQDALTANYIACSAESANSNEAPSTGAMVQIENCAITCQRLSCGDDAVNRAYVEGDTKLPRAPRGGNASPKVIIKDSLLTVNGNLACGGNGVYSEGSTTSISSDGGTAGEVFIESSTVNVDGDVSVGGLGGNGVLEWFGIGCTAGVTKSSCPVTIISRSAVTVTGNVATQKSLPSTSNRGTQQGLDGVTVTVIDSSLTAKDIASGGSGHYRVEESHTVASEDGYLHHNKGTDGGDGGKLIATNAQIECVTAVCGADGGAYRHEITDKTDASHVIGGDTACSGHPIDGNGGVLQSENSSITISKYAAERGTRWSSRENAAVYNNIKFIGGTLNGTVYGRIIITDVPSIIKDGFIASGEIRDIQGNVCTKCTFLTSEQLAGQLVTAIVNESEVNVCLNEHGTLSTYLSTGSKHVQINGTGCYYGEVEVTDSEEQNIFQLAPLGIIHAATGSALICEGSYSHDGKSYDYNGPYMVSGTGTQTALSVESGTHVITLGKTVLNTLSVLGTSNVHLELTDQAFIGAVNVDPEASLTVSGSGCLQTEMLGNDNGTNGTIFLKSGKVQANTLGGIQGGKDIIVSNPNALSVSKANSPLCDQEGKHLYLSEILFETPGVYTVTLNGQSFTAEPGEDRLLRLILTEGNYDVQLQSGPFCFQGQVLLTAPQCIRQQDLTLYADCSAGEIIVGEQSVSIGDETMDTIADICIIQTDEPHSIRVERTSVNIQLGEGTDSSLQIELPDNFQGTVRDASGILIAGPTLPEENPETPSEDTPVDGDNSDENNSGSSAEHKPETSPETPPETSPETPPETSPETPPETSPETPPETLPENPSHNETGSSGNTSQDTGSENNTTSGGSNTSGGGSTSGGSSTSGESSTSGGNTTQSGNTAQNSNSTQSDASHKQPEMTDKPVSIASGIADISIHPSIDALQLLDSSVQNVYKIFTRKKVSLTVDRKAGTEYYYKVLQKGQKNTAVKWQKLLSDKITVKDANKKQRIVLKAVKADQCTIQKTPGFMIDTKSPEISGIKNATFYKGKCTIRVADNSGSCNVSLNGKKMNRTFTLQKKGIYLLKATDSAGNKSTKLFAIL